MDVVITMMIFDGDGDGDGDGGDEFYLPQAHV